RACRAAPRSRCGAGGAGASGGGGGGCERAGRRMARFVELAPARAPSCRPPAARARPRLSAVDPSPTHAIAVVIPCFNLGAFLEETVASVRAHTRPAAEIVVVDDGSDDPRTLEVLARIPDLTGGRGRVERVPHGGVARARDHGCRATSSPYLLWLDADDLLDTTFLEKTAERLD